MTHLVDQGLDEFDVVGAEQAAQDRVGEPTEGAEGRRGAQKRVESLRVQLCLLLEGVALGEIPPVGHVPHDEEPPRLRGEPIGIGRRENEGQGVALQLGEAGVAVAHVEAQFVSGEAPGFHRQRQHPPRALVGRGVEDHLRQRPPTGQDLRLGDARLDHVDRRTGRERHSRRQGEEEGCGGGQVASARRLHGALVPRPGAEGSAPGARDGAESSTGAPRLSCRCCA